MRRLTSAGVLRLVQITKKMDGMEALAYLERSETKPDLILLDVMMPGLSGYEVRARAPTPISSAQVLN